MKVLTPVDLIAELSNPEVAQPVSMDEQLLEAIKKELDLGAIIVGMSASGLDGWMRDNLADKNCLQF